MTDEEVERKVREGRAEITEIFGALGREFRFWFRLAVVMTATSVLLAAALAYFLWRH